MGGVTLLSEETSRKMICEPDRKKKLKGYAGKHEYNDEWNPALEVPRILQQKKTGITFAYCLMFLPLFAGLWTEPEAWSINPAKKSSNNISPTRTKQILEISRTEFVYANHKRTHDCKCLLGFELPA